MNRPAGMEKPRSWKTTDDTTYPLGGRDTDSSAGTIHSTASVRGAAGPPRRDEGVARGRRWSVSSSTLRRQSLGRAGSASSDDTVDAKELGAQGASTREKKRMKCKVSKQRTTCGFKGDRPDSPPLAPGPPSQQDFRPHTRAPRRNNRSQSLCGLAAMTSRFPRDADLQSLCAVMMERSRQSRQPICPRP
jgi:hypothetical protein